MELLREKKHKIRLDTQAEYFENELLEMRFLKARVASLVSSRSHNTELATRPQKSQSPRPKLTVEKACWRTGK
jgi:hypothetical protein